MYSRLWDYLLTDSVTAEAAVDWSGRPGCVGDLALESQTIVKDSLLQNNKML